MATSRTGQSNPTARPAPTGVGKAVRRSARTTVQYEAYAAILHAAEALQRDFVDLLKQSDLSLAQYNVLRVLRGGGPEGLACGEVADRLVRHDPDMTRLLDRLEKRGLTERTRQASDRRVVRTRITAKGLTLLGGLDAPVDALHERQFGHIAERRLVDLAELLQEAGTRSA
jgi:DNA-binding MarR family transcriptional regulator